MPVTCVYKDCNASVARNPELKFARFVPPKTDFERASRWVKLIGREDFTINNIKYGTIICQNHFPPDSILDWRLNKSLEPIPSDMKSAVEELDYFPKTVVRAPNPKCYSSTKPKLSVTIPIAHPVLIENENEDINMSGKIKSLQKV